MNGNNTHNLLMQFFTPGSSKIEVFETYFFDTVTTQNDHPTYVNHVFGRIYVFFTLFGYWLQGGGGCSKRIGTRPAAAVFTLGSSKIEVSQTCFFDIVTTHNDHSARLKHVLGRICVFSTLFGYRVRGVGGVPKGLVHNLFV